MLYCICCGRRKDEKTNARWYLCWKCVLRDIKWGEFLKKYTSRELMKLGKWQEKNFETNGKEKGFYLTIEQMEKIINTKERKGNK